MWHVTLQRPLEQHKGSQGSNINRLTQTEMETIGLGSQSQLLHHQYYSSDWCFSTISGEAIQKYIVLKKIVVTDYIPLIVSNLRHNGV